METNNNLQSFSDTTIKALKYYVYALVNPLDNKIFYIGKGKDNRVFAHQNAVIKNLSKDDNTTLKIDIIKSIIKQDKQVVSYIIRHGLEENYAFELEATLINFLEYFQLSNLGNISAGFDTNEKGITTVEDIELEYAPKIITKNDFQHNILFLSINPSYDTFSKPVALYNRTRSAWNVDINKANNQVDFVIATHKRVFKEIYKVTWKPHYDEKGEKTKSYEFDGDVVEDSNIRELYLNKKFDERLFYGNPIRYIINNELTTEDEQ